MVNKKKRLFKILFFPISLLLCLSIFVISSFAQSGYVVEPYGDVKSLNLLDYSNRLQNKALDNNGNIVNNAYGAYVIDNIPLQPNTTYSSDISNGGGLAQFDSNMNFISTIDIVNNHTFTTSSNAFYFRMDATPNNHSPMLNEGSSILDYFPYGYFVNNSNMYNMSLYNLFNNSTVSLNGYYDNLNNSYTMAIDTLNLSIDQKYITLDDMPNIKNLISQGRSSSDWIVNADTYYITFYLNKQQANFSVLFADFVSSHQYIGLRGSYNGLYDKFIYNTSENSQSFIFSTNGVEYNFMYLFNELGYNENFQIGLGFSSSAYNDGYNDGYNSASSSGVAYDSGFNSGYQTGLNEGINSNLETNGIRTLFNSILSFPVDMIKSVFNFEFMGVNIASVIMFIVSIGIVAFVIKKFL